MSSSKARPAAPYRQLRGDERAAMIHRLADAYEAGASIRALAARHHLTYGTVRNLLIEGHVTLRRRGGAPRPIPA